MSKYVNMFIKREWYLKVHLLRRPPNAIHGEKQAKNIKTIAASALRLNPSLKSLI